MKLLQKLLIASTLVIGALSSAHAGLSVAGTFVDAKQISDANFETFYNYGNGNAYSANTGLEVANEVVIFLGQLASGEYGIYTIFSDHGGHAGSATVDTTATTGNVVFTDDGSETGLSFNWARNKTDGFIFGNIFGGNWSVDFDFSNISGLSALTVLSFDAAGNASTVFTSTGGVPHSVNISSVQVVNGPSIISLFAIGALFVAARRFK